jgi:hypothetical protein
MASEAILKDMTWVLVWVLLRNLDKIAIERAELALLLNKAGTHCLRESSLSIASGLFKSMAGVKSEERNIFE